jgi:hypothetical protein
MREPSNEPPVRAVEVVVGDPPEAWAALGFALDAGGSFRLGDVVVRAAGGGDGLLRVGVEGLAAERPGGFELVTAAATSDGAGEHPNGARAIDHVVAFTDSLVRSTAALEEAGIPLRRVRRPPEAPVPQAFLHLGTVILELVETGAPPSLWGLVVTVADLDGCAARLGERIGRPHAAVQEGRYIATVRPEAGLSLALALMSERPQR